MNIAVLLGGNSPEREISLRSGNNVAAVLRKCGYDITLLDPSEPNFLEALLQAQPDCVLPVLHGEGGEDGTIQGLLTIAHFPYVGSSVRASVVSMDKYITKLIAQNNGIPTPEYIYLHNGVSSVPSFNEAGATLGVPFIVKPCDVGSTIGLSLVSCEDEFHSALENAYSYSNKLLLEQFIDGYEITVGVYKLHGKMHTLPPIWIVKPDKVFDFNTKYTAGGARHVYELPINEEVIENLLNYAVKICQLVEIGGVARLDFIVKENIPYLLEINSIPGMTAESLVPDEVTHMGMDFGEFLEELLRDAL